MERDFQLLQSLASIKVGETFCFNYSGGAPLTRTSWTTSFYKRYNYENRYTMLDQITHFITRIEERDYVLEDIHNRELVDSVLPAAEGLRNLALSYEDDEVTNTRLNNEAARLAEVHNKLYNKLVRGVSIVAMKETLQHQRDAVDVNVEANEQKVQEQQDSVKRDSRIKPRSSRNFSAQKVKK